jgi:hypothetical protein
MATHNEPPPSYDCVMALDEVISRKRKNLYTFKAYHHHAGFDAKDCIAGHSTPTPTTPQVSLEETHCDNRGPSSPTSLCNCNCSISQTFTANLCTNCNTLIDSADGDNNNAPCSHATQDDCPLTCLTLPVGATLPEDDSLSDRLNNNEVSGDANGNGQPDASPSTSTSTHYLSCPVQLTCERPSCIEEDDEVDGNGNRRQAGSEEELSTINQNGLIRLDMSKIIDQTGLPTYEAALHLKSSGYV